MSKKKKAIIAVSVILSSIILIIAVFSVRENILRRAEETHEDVFEFDGKTYEVIDYDEIEPCKETLKVVCKTKDGIWTFYEIKEYPDLEYIVARTGWEGRVCKLVK